MSTDESVSQTQILSYRYRLLPTRQQHAALNDILEEQRQLYNAALQERSDAYRKTSRTITYYDQTNSVTACRQDALVGEEMSRVPAFLQHWTLKHLDDAYKAFFRRVKAGKGPAGFPRFRSRDHWRSFGFSQNGGFRLGGAGRCKVGFRGLPGYDSGKSTGAGNIPGGIRVHLYRPLPDTIGALGHRSEALRSIVLSRDPGERKWWISIQCKVEPRAICQSKTARIGIDLGVSIPIMQSDGVAVPIPAALKRSRKAERRAQRALARSKRGSKHRVATKQRLARIKAKQTAVRRQFAHVQSARLTRCYALTAFEELQISNMTRSAAGTAEAPGVNVKAKAGLNREILTVGWADLIGKHAYKAQRDGSRQVLVDPRGTSRDCSGCGAPVPKTLRQRVHHCPNCGLVLDRDANAAKNILARARGAPASTSSVAFATGAGLPPGRARNGAVGRRAPGNTAGESQSDGGRSSLPSIHITREPEAIVMMSRGPRQRKTKRWHDSRQLLLPFGARIETRYP